MLFLINTVVVKTQLKLELPPGLEQLRLLTPAAVLGAGRELFASRPRLEYDYLEDARWYCTLLQQKFPEASGAHFYPTETGYASQLAAIALPDLVKLWNLQSSGVDIAPQVHAVVWTRPRKVA